MTTSTLLKLVDAGDFTRLFIEELGWSNPDRPAQTYTVENRTYTLTQVAGYKGLRIWRCDQLPDRRTQRAIDALIGRDNHERLVLFTDGSRQEWRWPRRGRTSGANAALMVHPHSVGESNPHLVERLRAVSIGFDEDPSLLELLARMRTAFDAQAETAAVRASRLMGALYTQLEAAGVDEETATLLLARLLFLLFADDTGMWKSSPDLFKRHLTECTTPTTLHADLVELFDVLNTPEEDRRLPAGSPYSVFRYVNGGLFSGRLVLRGLPTAFRASLLEACEFDWGTISPAVFGSMFQVVRDADARRAGGEHYTTEKNILKTIGPLFLDELAERLEAAWDDKATLTRFLNELGRIRVLDPACGCGNFLVVAYRELRALELRALVRRRDLDVMSGIHTGGVNRSQMTWDVTEHVKVTLDHFSGIEIDEWPAQIAGTAMLLVDHLANQAMEEEFGLAPDRLPIQIAAGIVCTDALRLDWSSVVSPSEDVIIVGNPPFNGARTLSAGGRADMEHVWGPQLNPNFDFVTAWYRKTLDYFGTIAGRWAFVSTSSICQGEPVADLWDPILSGGWRSRFAHRSFRWESEAEGQAAVHVSILGFDRKPKNPPPVLWTYGQDGVGDGERHDVSRINPYLAEGPDVLVRKRTAPLLRALPKPIMGHRAIDKQHLMVEAEDYVEFAADPVAARYLRRFVGAEELLHNAPRWCLWMVDLDPMDLERSLLLRDRVDAVRSMRLKSKNPATRAAAGTPHLFGIRASSKVVPPGQDLLVIPAHVGENRRYFIPAHFSSDVICGNANFMAADPDGYAFAVLSSSMFITWMRAVGGRLESRLRFSSTFTYNTFPMPEVQGSDRQALVAAGQRVLLARAAHPEMSLAKLYSSAMPADLIQAHEEVDRIVDSVFKPSRLFASHEDRTLALFKSYAALTA